MQRFSFYDTALERLQSLQKSDTGIIRFPHVFYKLCSSFQITKETAWLVLMDLEKDGKIEIVRNNGVRIIN